MSQFESFSGFDCILDMLVFKWNIKNFVILLDTWCPGY